jgi:hypothetical protein
MVRQVPLVLDLMEQLVLVHLVLLVTQVQQDRLAGLSVLLDRQDHLVPRVLVLMVQQALLVLVVLLVQQVHLVHLVQRDQAEGLLVLLDRQDHLAQQVRLVFRVPLVLVRQALVRQVQQVILVQLVV